MADLQDFLQHSSIAERVVVPTRVVVHRTRLTTADIVELQNGDPGTHIPPQPTTCELATVDKVIARGKIVKKGGRTFFKVLETEEEL